MNKEYVCKICGDMKVEDLPRNQWIECVFCDIDMEIKKIKKINVGCGTDIREDWINLDSHDTNKADLIFNLNDIYKGIKLPFKDKEVDYVYCSHVLEDFIDPEPILMELVRICKDEGIIELKFPFETSTYITNICHKKCFTLSMFDDWIKNTHYGHPIPLEIIEREYYTDKGLNKFENIMKKIATWSYNKIGYSYVEKTFIKYLFPIVNIRIKFKKL